MSGNDLEKRLEVWAKEQLRYVPRRAEDNPYEKLCSGSMNDKWEYLIRHVKSKEEVRKIRGNLMLEKHRKQKRNEEENRDVGGKNSGDFTARDSSGSIFSFGHKEEEEGKTEKSGLIRDLKTQEKLLQKAIKKTESLRIAAEQFRKDCANQNESISAGSARLQNLRLESRILSHFVRKCEAEIRYFDDFAAELKRNRNRIFRMDHGEKIFTDEGGKNLENSAQHALRESTELAKQILESEINCSTNCDVDEMLLEEVHEKINQNFDKISAKEILGAFLQSARSANKNLKEIVDKIDFQKDDEILRDHLEQSGKLCNSLNPSGTFKTIEELLIDFSAIHVKNQKEAEKFKEKSQILEKQIEVKMEKIAEMLKESVPSEYERNLLFRNLSLEITFLKGQACLEVLKREVARMEKEVATKEMHVETLREGFEGKVADNEFKIQNKVAVMEEILSANHLFFGDFRSSVLKDVLDLVNDKILPLQSNLVDKMKIELKDLPLKRMKDFLSVQNIGAFKTSLIGSQLCQTSSLTIHRFASPLTSASDSSTSDARQDFFRDTLKDFDFLPQENVGKFLNQILEKKRMIYELSRWRNEMENNFSQKMDQNYLNHLKVLCCKLDSHEKELISRLEPRLEKEFERLKEAKNSVKKVEHAIKIWKEEPAQITIENEMEKFAVDNTTLKKFQEQYRVALAKWQQKMEQKH